jgi:hypothetical protein
MLSSEKKIELKARIEELCGVRETISSMILRLELELFKIDNIEPVDESLLGEVESLLTLEENVDPDKVSVKCNFEPIDGTSEAFRLLNSFS